MLTFDPAGQLQNGICHWVSGPGGVAVAGQDYAHECCSVGNCTPFLYLSSFGSASEDCLVYQQGLSSISVWEKKLFI